MKVVFHSLLLLFFLTSCKSQKVAIDNLHPIVQRAMETSLYSKNVDWKKVNAEFEKLTQGKNDVESLKPGLQFLVNSLGDRHAAFRNAKDFSMVVWYTGPDDTEDNRDPDFVNTVINDITAKFSYQLLEDNIGYLKVVGIGGGDVQQQAQQILDGLIDLKSKKVDRWILDLRYNGGGNMNPMLAGLAPLIGDGFIGGSINANNEVRRTYEIKDGLFYDWERQVCSFDFIPKFENNENVAVLLSRYTASSGELVAVTFKGRPNTRFIGEATAGYTTGNGFDHVTDDLVMMISQDYYMDRNKNAYKEKVEVDDKIEFRHTDDLSKDQQVLKAMDWLKR